MRRQNGHPEPYGVKYWGLGNEVYGADALAVATYLNVFIRHCRTVRADAESQKINPHCCRGRLGNVKPVDLASGARAVRGACRTAATSTGRC
ncbi:MAG: hypothetical protein M0Z94_13905 [Dehalococcoidales bacterium]|nr:hypothetical protein [Dehalococcoidales bacterium]